MISYEEALAILHAQEKLKMTALPVSEACGYTAAEDIKCDVLVPPFANSAMDGFAVRSADLRKATIENPIILELVGTTVAGDAPSSGASGAWEIMTGAPVPEGYDAVVKVEDTSAQNNRITFTEPVPMNHNIRKAGEDFIPGASIIKRGAIISPFHIMALATVGKRMIATSPKPKVTVFSTGKELVENAVSPLLPGQIRNSNGPYLMAALGELPVTSVYGGVIHDEPKIFEDKVKDALTTSDIIISSGAVSAGKHDFIPDSLKKLGAQILFHKVAIRPGKPVLYARFPNGAHYFGLPGNPISAAVGLRFFVTPLLRHIQGMSQERPITAKLLKASHKKKGLRFFRKAQVWVAADGALQLEILDGQESFKIHPMLSANCWASFAEDNQGGEPGDLIPVYPLTSEKWKLEPIL